MVTPTDFLKFQIKSELHMGGMYVEGKQLTEVVDRIFDALFNDGTLASVRSVLIDIQEKASPR